MTSNTKCLTGSISVYSRAAKSAAEAKVKAIMDDRRVYAKLADDHHRLAIQHVRSKLFFRLFRHKWTDKQVDQYISDLGYFEARGIPGYRSYLDYLNKACHFAGNQLQLCHDVIRSADIVLRDASPGGDPSMRLSLDTIRDIGMEGGAK